MVSQSLRFDGRVAIVTGAGAGLGRAHAMLFASRGCKVLIEDVNRAGVDAVVNEIKSLGGIAAPCYLPVSDGVGIVKACVDAFGTVHIVVNNAGILRDKSFLNMTPKQWDDIFDVHVKGAYAVTHAAWPIMREQKFGRVINTSSPAGIYGNVGQANYAAAKAALIGFTNTLAKEGAKYNITSNAIGPLADSQMTATILPQSIREPLKPEHISTLVVWLCHESCVETGSLFECGGGWFAKLRWQRSAGVTFEGSALSLEGLAENWDRVRDFSENNVEYPTAMGALEKILVAKL